MHRAVLAAVVTAALFAPAVAQQMNEQMNMNGQSPAGQDSQMQPQMQPEMMQPRPIPGSQAMAGHAIMPELLSTHQIRDVQRALAARGANPIRVDGQWGPDVELAIRDFQKAENMISQNGELDSLTLTALGLNPLAFGLSGASETTGEAVHDSAAPRIQEREPMHEMPEQPFIGGDEDR